MIEDFKYWLKNKPIPDGWVLADDFFGCHHSEYAVLLRKVSDPMMATGTGNRADAISARKDDLYETPPEAVWALLRHEPVPFAIWEPSCGPGAIVRVLRASGRDVVATDLVPYLWPADFSASGSIDFLMERAPPPGISAILTNPPFKLANEFVAHARELCPVVIMLLRLAFYESQRRSPILDAGDLARIYVFRKRLPMMHRDGWEGRKANSGMAFAWFVWDRSHTGKTVISRISWEPCAKIVASNQPEGQVTHVADRLEPTPLEAYIASLSD